MPAPYPASSGDAAGFHGAIVADLQAPAELREAAARYLEAEGAKRRGRWQECADHADEALTKFRELGHARGTVDSVALLAIGRHLAGVDAEEVERLLEESMGQFRQAGDQIAEAKLLLAAAEVKAGNCKHDDRYVEAVRLGAQARTTFQKQQDPQLEASALNVLTALMLRREKLSAQEAARAAQLAQEAYQLYEQVGDDRGMGMALHHRAWALVRSSSPPTCDEPLSVLVGAMRCFHRCGDRVLQARELLQLADWCLQLRLTGLGLPCASEALAALRGLACGADLLGTALEVVFRCYITAEDATQALQLAQEAVGLAKADGNRRMEADALLLVCEARVHQAQEAAKGNDSGGEASEEALKAAEDALEIARELEDEESEAAIAALIAGLHLRREDMEKAAYSAEEALWLFGEEREDVCSHAQALQVLLATHRAKQDHKAAAKAAQDLREVYRKAGQPGEAAAVMLAVMDMRSQQRDFDGAVAAARDAQQLFHEAGDARGEGQAMQSIALIRFGTAEHQRALYAAERARHHWQKLGDDREEAQMLLVILQCRLEIIARKVAADARIKPSWEELGRAARESKECAALCQRLGDRGLEAAALCAAARLHCVGERPQEAIEAADQAVSLFVVAGLAREEAMARVMCAKLYLGVGDLRKSLDEAREAAALARETQDEEVAASVEEVLNELRQFEFRVDGPGPNAVEPAAGATRGDAAAGTQAVAGPAPGQARAAPGRPDPALAMSSLQSVARQMIGSDRDVEADLPLFDVGITSMNAVLFRNKVMAEFKGADLPVTLVFDFPTLRGMAELLADAQV